MPPPPTQPVEGDLLTRAFNVDCEGPNSFAKLARYESALERSIDRSLRQLKAYQAARSTPDPRCHRNRPPNRPTAPLNAFKNTGLQNEPKKWAGCTIHIPAPSPQPLAPNPGRISAPTPSPL